MNHLLWNPGPLGTLWGTLVHLSLEIFLGRGQKLLRP